MKKSLIFGVLLTAFVFGFISCSEEDVVKDTVEEKKDDGAADTQDEEVKVDYSVGADIKIDGIDYVVVENTITQPVSRAVINGLIDTVSYSLARGLNYLHKYFNNCIIAIRKTGKFSAYQDYKTDEAVMAVFNTVVPEVIPDGYQEKDFFEWTTNSSNKHFYYRDVYYVLDAELKQIGQLDILWSSMSIRYCQKEDGSSVEFAEVFKDMDIKTLRSNIPEEYKVKSTTIGPLNDIYATAEGVIYSDQYISDDFRYVKEEIYPKVAAVIWRNYNITTGEWKSSNVCLMGKYGSETSTGMLRLTVTKGIGYNENGEENPYYTYSVTGASGYDGNITFDENNHFAAVNVEAGSANFAWNTGCTIYDDSGLPYCAQTRSVPIEFILNDDGTVEFGPSVYAWAKAWRDFVVENNETATSYN